MASSRIIATKRLSVFMAHICSVCGFPTISVVQIEAVAEKSYTFSQSKAEQIANETADKAINEEIERIVSCHYLKKPLVGKHKGSGMIAPGHFCTSSFSGYASCCPSCLSVEPWQSPSSKKKMDDLVKKNYPVVFRNANEAEKWAFDKVREMVAQIEAKREDPLEVEQAISKVKEVKAQILVWAYEMDSLPELKEYNKLREELAVARKQKASLGLLDFRLKRGVKRKIKLLEPIVKRCKEDRDKKVEPIARKIVDTGNELLTTQAIAFGVTNDILSKENGNAFSYFFSPNEIPANIMEEIESYVEQATNANQTAGVCETPAIATPVNNNAAVFCRKCGFKLLPDSTFCTKCGSAID